MDHTVLAQPISELNRKNERNVPIIESIVERYVDDASFLWILRNDAVTLPHYNLQDLTELDQRLQAQLNGLRIAGGAGWETSKKALLNLLGPGEVFVAAVLAFERGNPHEVEMVIDSAIDDPDNLRGLISALGWLPPKIVEPWLTRMISANAVKYRLSSCAALSVQRINPGTALQKAIKDEDPRVSTRALRAIGELKRKDFLPDLPPFFRSTDENIRFWSLWSAILLGDRSALEQMKPFFSIDSNFIEPAMQIMLRIVDPSTAQQWLQGFAQFPDTLRYLINGAGIVGDPYYIPWLLKQMENEEMARIAAEAFVMITGADFEDDNLSTDPPEGFNVGPNDNPADDNVAVDPDEDLPWPEPQLVAAWWAKNNHRFTQGERHLAGKPLDSSNCREVLRTGLQRQRMAAALELAVLEPSEILFEVRAPGLRQKQLLM